MKSISLDLKIHLAGEVTTLATCWLAELAGGAVMGFTDHTRDITFDGRYYLSRSGYTPTAVDTSAELNIDNLEIEAVLTSESIRERDLLAGVWDAARITVFMVNYEDLSMGRMILKSGTTGQITIKNGSFVAELRGLTQAYANNIVELTSPRCRAHLGDSRCKVNLTPFTLETAVEGVDAERTLIYSSQGIQPSDTTSSAITAISRDKNAYVTAANTFINGDQVYLSGITGMVQIGSNNADGQFQDGSGATLNGLTFIVANASAAGFSIPIDTRLGSNDPANGPIYSNVYSDYISGGVATTLGGNGYYGYGVLTFTTGQNRGLSIEVKSYVGGDFFMQLPFPFPIALGDRFKVVAGCAGRLIPDCKTKFNNVINFRGEPYLPGVDQAVTYGSPPEFINAPVGTAPTVANTSVITTDCTSTDGHC